MDGIKFVPWSIFLVITILMSLFLFCLIVSKKHLRQQPHCLIIANLCIATLTFGLLVRPGTIYGDIQNNEFNKGYCTMYLVLLELEWIVVTYGVWILSIERTIALREPDNHAKRFNIPGKIAIIAFPWVLGLILGLIVTLAPGHEIRTKLYTQVNETLSDGPKEVGRNICLVSYDDKIGNVLKIVWRLFGTGVPFFALILTGLSLMILLCKNCICRKDSGSTNVSCTSVVYAIVLDAMLCFALGDVPTGGPPFSLVHHMRFYYRNVLLVIVEGLVVVLALFIVAETRNELLKLCRCLKKDDEETNSSNSPKKEATKDGEI